MLVTESEGTKSQGTENLDVAEKDSDADDELAKRKLEELKQRIIDAGCSVQYQEYSSMLVFNDTCRYYSSPAELAAMIVKDFSTAISSEFPSSNANEIPAPDKNALDTEIALHRAYALNKARFFAGREKV